MKRWKQAFLSIIVAGCMVLPAGCAMPVQAPAPAPEDATAEVPETAAETQAAEADSTAAEAADTAVAPVEITADSGYEAAIFDTSYVHTVDVSIAPEDWELLLAEPLEKEKFQADVTIDGETITQVSFATKGNYSLLFVAEQPDSDRYSYRINFGKFVDDQTYHGLDKLSLNNQFSDATYMRDYICYRLFRQLEVDAPLTSYVWLTVNGEDRGLYMAVEDMDKGHLKRVYGGEGVIYKPEPKDIDLTPDSLRVFMETGENPQAQAQVHGADLSYTDDEFDSYPDILKNAETKAQDEDKAEVIAALKALSEGRPEDAFDTDEVVRFFAAHNFVLNYDSYTGAMLHNLLLTEQDGKLSLLPWDYNSAFGTFRYGLDASVYEDATDLLNTGIDTPLIGTTDEARQAWAWIPADSAYLEAYHDALQILLATYFESGEFGREVDEIAGMILPYVEKDPTAFYTAEEFEQAVAVMKEFNLRRAESVRRQLDGALAADSAQQAAEDKVDAADVKIDDMGSLPHAGEGQNMAAAGAEQNAAAAEDAELADIMKIAEITDRAIPVGDVTDFYYTYENINYNAFYQRYRFYVEDGKYMFHHETRERPGDYGWTTEEDITAEGTYELSEADWMRVMALLQNGKVSERNDDDVVDGDDGPWTFIYWKGDKDTIQVFNFASYGDRSAFVKFCEELAARGA